jgi:ribonuclease P protein component
VRSAPGRFRPRDRLLRPSEFRRVGREGRRASDEAFVLLLASSSAAARVGDAPRIGITVSRKVGSAVVRNRVKRRVREWFRGVRRELRPAADLVVIARAGAAGLSGEETATRLCRLAECVGATRG